MATDQSKPTADHTAVERIAMRWWDSLDTRQRETWLREAGGDLTTRTAIDAWWAYRKHHDIPTLECEWKTSE